LSNYYRKTIASLADDYMQFYASNHQLK
jgi:hypothetical protein